MSAGAIGGKITGGGKFLLVFTEPHHQKKQEKLVNLLCPPFGFECSSRQIILFSNSRDVHGLGKQAPSEIRIRFCQEPHL